MSERNGKQQESDYVRGLAEGYEDGVNGCLWGAMILSTFIALAVLAYFFVVPIRLG